MNNISSGLNFGAVPHLVKALDDDNRLVNSDAAAWLGKIRDKMLETKREDRTAFAGTAEFAALKLFHPFHEKQEFIKQLAQLREETASVPELTGRKTSEFSARLGSEDKDERHNALREMGETPEERFFFTAVKMLEDPHPYVRDEAARLTGLIGHRAGAYFLEAALVDEKRQFVRNTIAAAIGRIQMKNAMWPETNMLRGKEIRHFNAGVEAQLRDEKEKSEGGAHEENTGKKTRKETLREPPEWLYMVDELTGTKREIILYPWLSENARKLVDEITKPQNEKLRLDGAHNCERNSRWQRIFVRRTPCFCRGTSYV